MPCLAPRLSLSHIPSGYDSKHHVCQLIVAPLACPPYQPFSPFLKCKCQDKARQDTFATPFGIKPNGNRKRRYAKASIKKKDGKPTSNTPFSATDSSSYERLSKIVTNRYIFSVLQGYPRMSWNIHASRNSATLCSISMG